MKKILVPELSESVAEATLLEWHKSAGDSVREGDVLVEIETDKITMEVYASCDGVLKNIHLKAGSSVKGGDLLAEVEPGSVAAPVPAPAAAEAPAEAKPAAPSAAPATTAVAAAPSAKKIAKEQGVDLSSVAGSGKGGRITKGDVLQASAAAPLGARNQQRAAMSRARIRIAERLMESQHQTATLTTFNEVNMQAVMDLRAAYRDNFEKKHGAKLGFMSFFVKAAVAGLKEYPIVNASVDGNDILYHEYYDIGVAVAASRGLVVPVVRDADVHSMATIEKTISDFGKRAQSGGLSLDELMGGTFSITNGGVFGSMLSTPIINPPQSAILGIHATTPRPVVENGEVVVRPICYIALSYDHRIIDGREAVLFLVAVKNALENPARLLLEV
ncbi:MAG: 2-oxoglutarate dehydrogenase complex dihydrolipoyllysine-residue succinyltransferase [Proteobacteria bacterium]|nr:2-oxoglutarate dehydrogenase complex dihydrolipoyllysine-residue succinyltransferase [Pseudomonadota bacterium]